MKKMLLPAALLVAGAAQAQVQGKASETAPMKEGTVIYERTMQMRRPQISDPTIQAQIPTSRTDVFELLFTSGRSLWRSVPRADGGNGDIRAEGAGGQVMMIRTMGGNDETFTDLQGKMRIEKREMFDKEMVVADSVRMLPWKLNNETKTILGHTARKAVAKRIGTRMAVAFENGEMKRTPMADTSQIVAWYTTEIPVPVGPAEFNAQLPGLVLEVDINNGRQVIKAVEISPKVSASAIKEPKGKRLTPAEYDKERDAMMAEMQKNRPQGMQFRMNQ